MCDSKGVTFCPRTVGIAAVKRVPVDLPKHPLIIFRYGAMTTLDFLVCAPAATALMLLLSVQGLRSNHQGRTRILLRIDTAHISGACSPRSVWLRPKIGHRHEKDQPRSFRSVPSSSCSSKSIAFHGSPHLAPMTQPYPHVVLDSERSLRQRKTP